MNLGILNTWINKLEPDTTHEVEEGTRVLVVGFVRGTGTTMGNIYWNGTPLTQIIGVPSDAISIWIKTYPEVGTYNITAANYNTAAGNWFAANLLSATTYDPGYSYVEQTTSGTSSITTVVGSIVFDVGMADMNSLGDFPAAGPNQVEIYNTDNVGNTNAQFASYQQVSSVLTTMSWTGAWSNISRALAVFNEGPAPGNAPPQFCLVTINN